MAYLMFQYDRPTDTRNWNNYNRHVQDWIAQLLKMPGGRILHSLSRRSSEQP